MEEKKIEGGRQANRHGKGLFRSQNPVQRLLLRPAFQNKGYGSLFIKEIGRILKEMGVAYILLDTVKTYKAYSFYLKNGFKEIKDDVGLFLKLG